MENCCGNIRNLYRVEFDIFTKKLFSLQRANRRFFEKNIAGVRNNIYNKQRQRGDAEKYRTLRERIKNLKKPV